MWTGVLLECQEPFVLGGKREPDRHAPSSNSHPFLGEDSEVKPSRWTAEWVWLGDLLLQHQETDTKMLERAATTPQTEQGKLPCF